MICRKATVALPDAAALSSMQGTPASSIFPMGDKDAFGRGRRYPISDKAAAWPGHRGLVLDMAATWPGMEFEQITEHGCES